MLLSEIVTFLIKRDVFSEFPTKYFKTTEKDSLTVCCSFWGEEQFSFIFVQFYCFEQKGLLQQILIFLWICSFSNLLRETNFLIISELLSEMFFFDSKVNFSVDYPKNASKQQESIVWRFVAHFEEFVNIWPVLLLWTKSFVYNKSKFSYGLPPFKFVEKNKLSKYFCASLRESLFWLKREDFIEFPKNASKQQKSIV